MGSKPRLGTLFNKPSGCLLMAGDGVLSFRLYAGWSEAV